MSSKMNHLSIINTKEMCILSTTDMVTVFKQVDTYAHMHPYTSMQTHTHTLLDIEGAS